MNEWLLVIKFYNMCSLMNLIGSMCSDIIFKILRCTKSGILTDIVSSNGLTLICRHAPIRTNDST